VVVPGGERTGDVGNVLHRAARGHQVHGRDDVLGAVGVHPGDDRLDALWVELDPVGDVADVDEVFEAGATVTDRDVSLGQDVVHGAEALHARPGVVDEPAGGGALLGGDPGVVERRDGSVRSMGVPAVAVRVAVVGQVVVLALDERHRAGVGGLDHLVRRRDRLLELVPVTGSHGGHRDRRDQQRSGGGERRGP
jgi:hypothetical protein